MTIKWSIDELKEHLYDQVGFLKSSCQNYDQGSLSECKRLAAVVRTLLHDTKNSKSLFNHLQMNSKKFLDTALPYDDRNIGSHAGLVCIAIGGADEGTYAFLDDDALNNKLIDFDSWWNGIVFVDKNKYEFSRKDIVLALTNKDGGAHIDKQGLPKPYKDLTKHNSLGIMRGKNGIDEPIENQVPPTMRQIAHELLKTIDSTYSCNRPSNLNVGFWTMGGSIIQGDHNELLSHKEKNLSKTRLNKIGRNDLCHCGSGKKYKKCHL